MILVTGGTGFIGSHLLDRLASLHLPFRCMVRPTSDLCRLPEGATTVNGDLATGEGLGAALDGVATVIHLAGVTKALRPQDYFTGNAQATGRLVEALEDRKIRFVHVSSLAAVGPAESHTPVEEETAPHPLTNYGKSKLEAERLVRRGVPDAVIVRPPVVYGPRDTDVFQLLQSIARGVVLEIAGGERWFSAIYVEDLVDGILSATRAGCAAGRTYFLAHPKPVSWSELGAEAARIMGRSPRIVRVPARVAYGVGACAEIWARARRKPGIISREKIIEAQCPRWVCDTRRATDELGFEAATPLAAGLSKTLAWYKEAGWLKY